ncbi:hypothetical protein ACFVW9_24235 [Streptomyces sp. NPDC058217]
MRPARTEKRRVRNQRFQTKMQAREKVQGAADGWDDNASAGLT